MYLESDIGSYHKQDDKSGTKNEEEAGLSPRPFPGHNSHKGMVLPFQPLSLTFDEIRYSVDMPQVFGDLMCSFFTKQLYFKYTIFVLNSYFCD